LFQDSYKTIKEVIAAILPLCTLTVNTKEVSMSNDQSTTADFSPLQKTITFKEALDEVAKAIPKYRRIIFKTIVCAMVIGKDRKRIAAIFRSFATFFFQSKVTEKRFYLFLAAAKIKWDLILAAILELLGEKMLTDGLLMLIVDDTTYGKSGKKISGCQTHFDHAAKLNCSKWIFGHCRVILGLQIFVHGRWTCLPLLQQLYQRSEQKSGTKANKKNTGKRKKSKKSGQNQLPTKIEIAFQLINRVRRLTGKPVLVNTDSWFGVKSMLDGLDELNDQPKAHVLSRLRINVNLFNFPVIESGKKRGRPRKYGKQLPKLTELATSYDRHQGTFFIYGKQRKCVYSEFTCICRCLRRPIKVVLVHNEKRERFFPIFTTDLTMSAQQMIERYSARWKIECSIKELKHELGALDNQARKETSVENHFNLCCLSMTLAWIHALNQDKAPTRRFANQSAHSYAFADVREQIKNQYQRPLNITGFCPKAVKAAGNLILEHFFRQAA
jgi:SRSO17 transposase